MCDAEWEKALAQVRAERGEAIDGFEHARDVFKQAAGSERSRHKSQFCSVLYRSTRCALAWLGPCSMELPSLLTWESLMNTFENSRVKWPYVTHLIDRRAVSGLLPPAFHHSHTRSNTP